MGATQLGLAAFAPLFLGRSAADPIATNLFRAAVGARYATRQDALREAAGTLAEAIKAIGISQWPRFVANAAERARHPATVAAVEKSRQPPDLRRDAITPVYPIETIAGVVAAGVVGGLAAVVRAIGGAVLKEVLPEAGLTSDGLPTIVAGRNATSEKPEATVFSGGGETEAASGIRPIRLHEGQQGKHIEGSKNYDPTRSTLTADPQKLLNRFAGQGEQRGRLPVGQPGSKEMFDTGNELIGINRARSGGSAPTTRGVIHYSKRGAHVVPASPRK